MKVNVSTIVQMPGNRKLRNRAEINGKDWELPELLEETGELDQDPASVLHPLSSESMPGLTKYP